MTTQQPAKTRKAPRTRRLQAPTAKKAGSTSNPTSDRNATSKGSRHTGDRSGHRSARHASDVEADARAQVGPAEPSGESAKTLRNDDLAEELGEAFVRAATGGEESREEMLEQVVPEETGGPFVETSSDEEIAYDVDASNPPGATREPFPTS